MEKVELEIDCQGSARENSRGWAGGCRRRGGGNG